jgi:hypothetical protein
MRIPWEHDENTLGTRNKQKKKPLPTSNLPSLWKIPLPYPTDGVNYLHMVTIKLEGL